MTATRRPLQDLVALVAERRTGEFICASASVEFHVYLQHGRVAWATASSHPFEFARHIRQHSSLDETTFRAVVEDCRRARKPLGETLVAWGLVSWDAVKAALRHQIQQTVEALAQLKAGSTLFLERKKYTEYNVELTLELAEVAPRPAGPPPQELSGLREPSAANGTHRAQQLYEAVEGTLWVELLDGYSSVERAPAADGRSHVPSELLERTLDDGAEFVGLRSGSGSIVGARLPVAGKSLWCRLAADSTFGAAVSTVLSMCLLEVPPPGAAAVPERPDEPWAFGDLGSASGHELKLLLERAPEVRAALVLTDDRLSLGLGRGRVDQRAAVELVRRRARVFELPVLAEDSGAPHGFDALGFRQRSLVTADGETWCFGTDLHGDRTQSAWVLQDRSQSQGLGWACLTALARGLTHALPGRERP